MAALRPASVTIDGEAVCCDDAGVAVFEKLHSRAHDGRRSYTPSTCSSSTARIGGRGRSSLDIGQSPDADG
jgi:hypothetical protein